MTSVQYIRVYFSCKVLWLVWLQLLPESEEARGAGAPLQGVHVVEPRASGRLLRAAQRLANARDAALDGAPAARRLSRRHRHQALRRPRAQRLPLRRRPRALHAAARPGLPRRATCPLSIYEYMRVRYSILVLMLLLLILNLNLALS